jgi:DNA invertase Pin-like site-specific DNA recombinase
MQKSATSRKSERALGYVRVSRVGARAGESFISPELQRETIAGVAERNDLRVVELVEDLDESGGKYDRPGFQRAIEAVERGEVDVIVVAKLTRFARSVLDTHRALERIEAAGGRLVAADVDVDTSTATGRMIRGLLATLAEFELELTRENWQAAKAAAVERGVSIKSTAPFGYRFDEAHRLEVEPAEAPIVVELFEARAGGASWAELRAIFEARTGRRSSRNTVARMMRNRAYVGAVVYGRSQELRNEEAHAAIVERDLFERVQAVSDERAGDRVGRRGHAGRAVSLLGGIARCEACGEGLGLSTKGGRQAPVYQCGNSACTNRASIRQADLDAFVEEAVLEWAGAAADEVVEVEAGPRGDRAGAELRLAEAERLVLEYETDVELELELGSEAYKAGRRERLALVERRRAELEAIGEASELETLRTTLRAAWPELETSERRRLIRVVLAAVIVRRTPRRGAPASERADLSFNVGAIAEPPSED